MIAGHRAQLLDMHLKVIQRLNLSEVQWQHLTALIRRLRSALRSEDDDAVRRLIAEIWTLGDSRGSPGLALESAGPPTSFLLEAEGVGRQLDELRSQVTRTPHLDLDGDVATPLSPGQVFGVEVYLDTAHSRPGEETVEFEAETAERILAVDVWLTASAHLDITSPATGRVELDRTTARSTSARFSVRVRDDLGQGEPGPAVIQARFDYRLRGSGMVRRTIAIDGVVPHDAGDAPVSAARVVVRRREHVPDLSVSVTRSSRSYRVKVATEQFSGAPEECDWDLGEGSAQYVSDLMAEFVNEKASRLARSLALRGAGQRLFRDAPTAFTALYWKMVDAGAPPRTMLLQSDERSVPWELMVPERHLPNGEVQTLPPLGASCAVGRWHHDEYLAPPQSVPLNTSLVLAPVYVRKLPKSAEERDLVLRLFPGQVVPGTVDELDTFMRAHSASLLHLVCHGRDATVQSIGLERNQSLSADQAYAGGVGLSCRASKPLVFLNACEIGRPGAGLISAGGFPASFMRSGASAVVAPLWAVDDEAAHRAAVLFYESVRSDPTVTFAEVIRRLREGGLEPDGEDSHAAYVFYGDPFAAAGVTP